MAGKAEPKKILTIAEIDKLPLAERKKLYKTNAVNAFDDIRKARDKFTSGIHVAAKVHASLKREHVALLAVGTLAAGTSEKEFFE